MTTSKATKLTTVPMPIPSFHSVTNFIFPTVTHHFSLVNALSISLNHPKKAAVATFFCLYHCWCKCSLTKWTMKWRRKTLFCFVVELWKCAGKSQSLSGTFICKWSMWFPCPRERERQFVTIEWEVCVIKRLLRAGFFHSLHLYISVYVWIRNRKKSSRIERFYLSHIQSEMCSKMLWNILCEKMAMENKKSKIKCKR